MILTSRGHGIAALPRDGVPPNQEDAMHLDVITVLLIVLLAVLVLAALRRM